MVPVAPALLCEPAWGFRHLFKFVVRWWATLLLLVTLISLPELLDLLCQRSNGLCIVAGRIGDTCILLLDIAFGNYCLSFRPDKVAKIVEVEVAVVISRPLYFSRQQTVVI